MPNCLLPILVPGFQRITNERLGQNFTKGEDGFLLKVIDEKAWFILLLTKFPVLFLLLFVSIITFDVVSAIIFLWIQH